MVVESQDIITTIDNSESIISIIEGGGANKFTQLTDTPTTYSGQAGKAAVVNSVEDALEFSTVTTSPAGSDGQIQFNEGGAFGADSGLNWDNINKKLNVTNSSFNGVVAELENTSSGSFVPISHFFTPNLIAGQRGQLRFGTTDSNANSAEWRYRHQSSGNSINSCELGFYGKSTPMISYRYDGSVGINTDSPTSLLDIYQGTDSNGIKINGFDDMSSQNLRFYMDSFGTSNIVSSISGRISTGADLQLYANSGNGAITMRTNGLFITTAFSANPTLKLDGYITAATDKRYIQFQVDDTDDYLNLSREDDTILGFKINMPTVMNEDVSTLRSHSLIFKAGNTREANIYQDGSSGEGPFVINSNGFMSLRLDNTDRIKIRNGRTEIQEVLTVLGDTGLNETAPDTLLTLSQYEDSNGIKINGFDDKSGDNLNMFIDSAGWGTINSDIINFTGNQMRFSAGETLFSSTNNKLFDNRNLLFGDSGDISFKFDTTDVLATFKMGLSSASNIFLIGNGAYMGDDFDHLVQTNPTIIIHSATDPDVNNTQWLSFQHDKTDGIITTGAGAINLAPASGLQINGTDGFTGTGAYTNFTIQDGIITSAS